MLLKREEAILRLIAGDYIATAIPVSSEVVARKHAPKISPATARNDMARLEEEGFIHRPHTSAGAVPTEKGYRLYVEGLAAEKKLSLDEELAIRKVFREVEQCLDGWIRLATIELAKRVRSVAVVTFPLSRQCHFKRLELVALQEFLVQTIFVMKELKLKQHLIVTDQPVTQDQLVAISNKLNDAYDGLTYTEICTRKLELSPLEDQLAMTVAQLMRAEDERQQNELCIDGLRHLLAQPEFANSSSAEACSLLELIEGGNGLASMMKTDSDEQGVKVTIGTENEEEALSHCSVVICTYGIQSMMKGNIGAIGPTRMNYMQTISTVNSLSLVMSELFDEVYS